MNFNFKGKDKIAAALRKVWIPVRTAAIRISRNRRFRKGVRYLSIAVSALFIYYLLFSNLFETPIDYELRMTNQQLSREYRKLSKEYELIAGTVQNIRERDTNIYERTFNIKPVETSGNREKELLQRRVSLSALPDVALARMFYDKANVLQQEIGTAETEYDQLEKNLLARGRGVFALPSIQPVYNPDNQIHLTPAGLRINPFYKGTALHKGIDYALPEDTRVFATAEGVVAKTGDNASSRGKSIEINHGNGYTTLYGHLNKAVVKRGQRVMKGEVIGYSGNTGYSFVPHLHYEVHYNGREIDPMDFFFSELDPYQLRAYRERSRMNIQSMD